MMLYVAGAADADEAMAIEIWLGTGSPAAAALHAEACAVFNAIPFVLSPVEPPASVRHAVLGRATAASQTARPADVAGRLRWPIYASTGLAACLAVALGAALWNNRVLERRAVALSANVEQLQDQNRQMVDTQQLVRSPTLSMVSLKTQSPSAGTAGGRMLYCPVTRMYQITVFGMAALPATRAYELWLITADGRKLPAGTFTVNQDGTGALVSHPSVVAQATQAAVTDEPAGGSDTPTGIIHLAGALQPLH